MVGFSDERMQNGTAGIGESEEDRGRQNDCRGRQSREQDSLSAEAVREHSILLPGSLQDLALE